MIELRIDKARLRRYLLIWSAAAAVSVATIWFMTSGRPDALAGPDLDRRLKARFAIGSPERDLVKELQREGFTTQEGRATRTDKGCTARVEWKSDPAGRLTAIGGTCS